MRRHRRTDIEDTQDTGRWLISYADFITLLFAFFVVMYSISQVNQVKYEDLSSSLVQAFDNRQTTNQPIQFGEISRSLNPITGDDIEQPELDSDNIDAGLIDSENFATTEEFKELENGLRNSLGDLINQDLAEIKSDANWINITLRSALLFPLGSDELNQGADILLEEVSKLINTNNQMILVHGHTDNIPIATERFPSNWELSSARAVAVVRKMQNLSVYAPRMAIQGHGEYLPIVSNDTSANRAKNRRVVISISRKQRMGDKQNQQSTNLGSQSNQAKDTEPEFQIVRLPNGELLIRGKELPQDDNNEQN